MHLSILARYGGRTDIILTNGITPTTKLKTYSLLPWKRKQPETL